MNYGKIANVINELRAAKQRIESKKLDPWKDRNTIGVWGDLDQAIDMLGPIEKSIVNDFINQPDRFKAHIMRDYGLEKGHIETINNQ